MDTFSLVNSQVSSGWQAHLKLKLEMQLGRTVVARREHFGPLQIQRAFYPEADGTCHVYILHPPGGIVGGDELDIEIDVDADAKCLITTPGASKIYRNTGENALINQRLTVRKGGTLEWLPQETIVFESSHSINNTDVFLQTGAEFCGWDIVCLGRPAANESFGKGRYRQNFRIWRDQKPLCIESNLFEGGAETLYAPWGLSGFTVVGTFLFVTDDRQALLKVREQVPNHYEGCRFSVSQTQDVLIARYLGNSSEQAKKLFTEVWNVLRSEIYKRPVVRPRIWDT